MDHAETMKDLAEKWQAAASSDVFANLRKVVRPAPQNRLEDFQDFQRHVPPGKTSVNDEKYWDLVAKAAKNPQDAPDVIEYLNEQEKYTNNPVFPTTYGMDQSPQVNLGWLKPEDFAKINKIKLDLHDLGDKYAAAEATMDAKAKGLWEQIKTLRSKIDELSDSLAPNRAQEPLS